MKIMAFDSTAKSASVSVLDGERVLAEYTVDNGLTQSELLLPMAEDMASSERGSGDALSCVAWISGVIFVLRLSFYLPDIARLSY